jgi:tetratricopeptide (TPR) repeat protein
MKDFYEILGLTSNATPTEIRAAYKRLAMEFHPDRNPGNPEAEERFKMINEAYHVLSDPIKKTRYDARTNSGIPSYDDIYWQQVQRARYRQWQQAQQPRYVFDKEYFRIQGLAFAVFVVIAGFCFGLIHTVNYYYQQQQEEKHRQNMLLIAQVNSLFGSGKVEEAFRMITQLYEQSPLDYEFVKARDSLVDVLRTDANQHFEAHQFELASIQFEQLQRYEFPQRVETLEKLATSLFRSAQFEKCTHILKQLYALHPWDIEVVYQLGAINYQYTHDLQESHKYLTIAKELFKETMSHIYGKAFEVVMDPKDAPEIYYQVFLARARTNYDLRKFKEAETDCNWAVFLRPDEPAAYVLRAAAKAETKTRGLCTDLRAAQERGAEVTELRRKYCQ